jgi:hypothetical protein
LASSSKRQFFLGLAALGTQLCGQLGLFRGEAVDLGFGLLTLGFFGLPIGAQRSKGIAFRFEFGIDATGDLAQVSRLLACFSQLLVRSGQFSFEDRNTGGFRIQDCPALVGLVQGS